MVCWQSRAMLQRTLKAFSSSSTVLHSLYGHNNKFKLQRALAIYKQTIAVKCLTLSTYSFISILNPWVLCMIDKVMGVLMVNKSFCNYRRKRLYQLFDIIGPPNAGKFHVFFCVQCDGRKLHLKVIRAWSFLALTCTHVDLYTADEKNGLSRCERRRRSHRMS